MQTCPDCGGAQPARFAHCGRCGHRFVDVDPILEATESTADVGRTATVLTSDLLLVPAIRRRTTKGGMAHSSPMPFVHARHIPAPSVLRGTRPGLADFHAGPNADAHRELAS